MEKITAREKRAIKTVEATIKQRPGAFADKTVASLRRKSGIHGTAWILLNTFAPKVKKPKGLY